MIYYVCAFKRKQAKKSFLQKVKKVLTSMSKIVILLVLSTEMRQQIYKICNFRKKVKKTLDFKESNMVY